MWKNTLIFSLLSSFFLAHVLLTAIPANADPSKQDYELSENSMPDLTKLEVIGTLANGVERLYRYPETNHLGIEATVAITTAMPWAPDQPVLWEWRIERENGWRYFAAFSRETITEGTADIPYSRIELDASGAISGFTIILRDKQGNLSGTQKTFLMPQQHY